jgi:glycosyltransferase involved in cell wall biosynthesis
MAPPPPSRASRRQRIAIVIFGLGRGGAEHVVCTIAGHWARDGAEVSVVTLAPTDEDANAVPPGVTRVSLEVAGDSRGLLDGLGRSIGRVWALRRALLRLDPDVVVAFMTHTNVLCIAAMAGTGVPVLACERTHPRRAGLDYRWALLRRVLYPLARGVVVQTEAAGEWARAFCSRVHVIPNFVTPTERLAGPLDVPGPKRIFAAGRLVPSKGFALLIEAFARLAPDRPEWSLTILGEGPERARLEAQVAAAGLTDRVALPGHVSNPRNHFIAGHAFVLSSLFEGFPNALLEAMSCGLPVVACDCESGPADAITQGRDGLLVPVGDVPALATALARIMDDPGERTRLGRNAAAIASKLGPEPVLAKWEALLQSAALAG